MQFFGQLLVHAEAVQQERSANATGTIVIPFPSGESKNTETVPLAGAIIGGWLGKAVKATSRKKGDK